MAAKKERRRAARPKQSQTKKSPVATRQSVRSRPRRSFDVQGLLRYAILAAVFAALGSGLVIGGAVMLAQRQAVPSLEQEIFGDDQGQMNDQVATDTDAGEGVVELTPPVAEDPVEPPVLAGETVEGGEQLSDWEASEPAAAADESAGDAVGGIQYYDSQHSFRLDFLS